jgi:alcohol dehydrogenase class IV
MEPWARSATGHGIIKAPNVTQHPVLARYIEIGNVTGDKDAIALDGVKWTSELVTDLKVPMLSEYGLSEEAFPEAVEKTMKANSFKGNPIALNEAELRGILEKAI